MTRSSDSARLSLGGQVGECFVYEAARVLHSRPSALRGRVFANAFCHFTLAEWRGDGARTPASFGAKDGTASRQVVA